ncbi:bestrophin [Nibricoccus aquaticus]|uniref:Bestrophin n=1 Tax=Nibricoccus aquaticus TaxID=2576891 RepID=A0A290QDR2_9BACT|nr:bestrophin family ion channel [Nibricoccus aquaticus]ATC63468.1 bestrophin [Nibricoccus aquaticus]
MIVRPKPSTLRLFFILQGSILPTIAPRLLMIAALATAVAAVHHFHPGLFGDVPVAPFTLLGLSLSLFLGFRNNACYDRWWEARKLWGQLIFEMRSFARETAALLPPEEAATRQRLLYRAIGFAHVLSARLRGENVPAVLKPWISETEFAATATRPNPNNTLLETSTRELADCVRRRTLSEFLFPTIEARLTSFSFLQTACERILNTPLPFAYTLLLHRTALLFCVCLPFAVVGAFGWFTPLITALLAYAFFGLDALGDELEDPFGLTQNDLPLHAMARTIEIDLRDSLGEKDLPTQLQPVNFLLQ